MTLSDCVLNKEVVMIFVKYCALPDIIFQSLGQYIRKCLNYVCALKILKLFDYGSELVLSQNVHYKKHCIPQTNISAVYGEMSQFTKRK